LNHLKRPRDGGVQGRGEHHYTTTSGAGGGRIADDSGKMEQVQRWVHTTPVV